MNLIAILITLGTENLWKSFRAVRPYQWLLDYTAWLWQRVGSERWFGRSAGVLLALAPGVLVVGLIQLVLASGEGFFAWLIRLAFAVAVLIVSIGVRGLEPELEEYRRSLDRDDHDGAYLHVRELLREGPPASPDEMNRKLIEVMLIRNNERLLAILFWFALVGPVGVVLYRSICQLKGVRQGGIVMSSDFLGAVLRVHAVLDWIPARITAICYAIIGSFVEAMQQWRAAVQSWRGDLYTGNRQVLINSGMGALRLYNVETGRGSDAMRDDIIDAEAMINRTVIVWLTAFALLTIAGWLS
ncbi:MAG: regulatory signaling modulator protein AmpE [Gammaproteobacteria bacterium]|nr:regulatory signaling modulator protein AmpE [Gammaproteobacteria bacterium]